MADLTKNEYEIIRKMVYEMAASVQEYAVEGAPFQSGKLRSDIQIFEETAADILSGTYRSPELEVGHSSALSVETSDGMIPYPLFVHEGTGIYGEKKRPIRPTKAKALKTPYGPKAEVKGQQAQPYLKEAFAQFVSSGKMAKLVDRYGDQLSESLFERIRENVRSIEAAFVK